MNELSENARQVLEAFAKSPDKAKIAYSETAFIAVTELFEAGLAERVPGGGFWLTDAGRRAAQQIVGGG